MRKQKGILIILAAVFMLLFVACENELPQGTPRPSMSQPTETPPSPSPTPDPYCGITESWTKWQGVERDQYETVRLEYQDTPATGEREAPSELEQRILSGECVLLENGVELDLDGNGTKEKICWKDNNEVICVGEFQAGGGYYSYSAYTGRAYGVCLDALNPSQIHILIEKINDWEKENVHYTLLTYRQMDGYCYAAELGSGEGFLSETWGIPFSPEEWMGLSEAGSYTADGIECFYRSWTVGEKVYSEVFERRIQMEVISRIAVTTTDIFAYDERYILQRVGYIPAGSRLLVLCGNDNMLYVTDCSHSVHALIRLRRTGDKVMVEAPYEVSLEDALRYVED